MLGHLLNSFNPARRSNPTPRNLTQSELYTETTHTRHLLFPDTLSRPFEALDGPSWDGNDAYDDLQNPRDIRIIVAQGEFGALPEIVLFDSNAALPTTPVPRTTKPAPKTSDLSSLRGHTRKSSTASESGAIRSPTSPTAGPLQWGRSRAGSISLTLSNIDEGLQGRTKESDKVVGVALGCMFENAYSRYRGVSNKIKVIPLEPRQHDAATQSPSLGDSSGSFGRADGRKRSNLAISYTPSDTVADRFPSKSSLPQDRKDSRRRTVLLMRTFSVALPESEDGVMTGDRTPTPSNSLGKAHGFPFPSMAARASSRRSSITGNVTRTPMYGVCIAIRLPVAQPHGNRTVPRGNSRWPASVPGSESLPSSFDLDRRAGWMMADPLYGTDGFSASSGSDVDDYVDLIGRHWDVIVRTLATLHELAAEKIIARLRVSDVGSPSQNPIQTPNPRYRRRVSLKPYALAFDDDLKRSAFNAGERIVRGMIIPRVRTGQGKWALWREEARWVNRLNGSKDEFLATLLTAFLGTHMEWLDTMGPKQFRKRHWERRRASSDSQGIASRTVLVSNNAMAARRLVFLLAEFLPSAPKPTGAFSPRRPATSASLRAYSQSPPTNVGTTRNEFLRRTINRRAKGPSSVGQQRIGGRNGTVTDEGRSPVKTSDPDGADERRHRRTSEVPSAPSLSLATDVEPAVRKSGPATPSTVTPTSSTPVRFAVQRTHSSGSILSRPDSSGSLASANLMNNLHRATSAQEYGDSQSTSRWNSLKSFWSLGTRQDSSTDYSDIMHTTDEGLGISAVNRNSQYQPNQLERMVNQLAGVDRDLFAEDLQDSVGALSVEALQLDTDTESPGSRVTPAASATESPAIAAQSSATSAARAIPERGRTQGLYSPLKMSVNETDGVIDVEIPFFDSALDTGFSLASPAPSPLLPGFNSSPSVGGSDSVDPGSFGSGGLGSLPSMSACFHGKDNHSVNVAGWLKKFHPDFELQSVLPYNELERDIRDTMRAEPTPTDHLPWLNALHTPESTDTKPLERWVDVCSTVIADTTSFTVRRLTLKRLVKPSFSEIFPSSMPPTPALHPPTTPGGILGHHRGLNTNFYSDGFPSPSPLVGGTRAVDEKFVEENLTDKDPALGRCLRRLLASDKHSLTASLASSRSSSRRGADPPRPSEESRAGLPAPSSGIDIGAPKAAAAVPPGEEVPPPVAPEATVLGFSNHECKLVVMEALEEVVKGVAADLAKWKREDAEGRSSGHRGQKAAGSGSVLQEGIRRWMQDGEEFTS